MRVARRWGGLVDMTPDGLPAVDGGARPDKLVVVTSLRAHGVTLGLALGEVAADLAVAGRTYRDLQAFRHDRFTGKAARPTMMM